MKMLNKHPTIIPLDTVIPVNNAVIPTQAGIHQALQELTTHGFRLQATGMTRWRITDRILKRIKCRMLRMPSLVKTTRHTLQSGFTLLEMILVLFLVSLMASATLMLTEGVEDQAKYDDTKRRMEIMRKAIVGDPTRTVNGGPEISGFVADMGRLPLCVAELLTPGSASGASFQSPCNGSEITAWDIDTNTGIWFGWHGPYIQVLPERNDELHFRDGYGNTGTDASDVGGTNLDASSTADDEHDSGWSWLLSDSSDASNAIIQIQSYGFDGTEKYPQGVTVNAVRHLINQRDHLINMDNWSGQILFSNSASTALPTSNATLKLRLHYPDGSGSINSIDSDNFSIDVSNAVPANDSRYSEQITFSGTEFVPWGVRSVEVLCDSDNSVFDGTCPSGVASPDTFRTLTLLPYSQVSTFNFIWDIP